MELTNVDKSQKTEPIAITERTHKPVITCIATFPAENWTKIAQNKEQLLEFYLLRNSFKSFPEATNLKIAKVSLIL